MSLLNYWLCIADFIGFLVLMRIECILLDRQIEVLQAEAERLEEIIRRN